MELQRCRGTADRLAGLGSRCGVRVRCTPTFRGSQFLFLGTELDEHGTHVAGTIGGNWNGAGVDGVNPFASLFLIDISTLADAAWRAGNSSSARVVNMSLGHNWYQWMPPTNPMTLDSAQEQVTKEGAAFETALRALVAKGNNLPYIIAAAGNDSNEPKPEQCRDRRTLVQPHVECGTRPWRSPTSSVVEALGPMNRGGFSNDRGDIGAPGVGIVSASWQCPAGSTCPPGAGASIWQNLNGTSMATPHVSGIVSYFTTVHPTFPSPTLNSNPLLEALQLTSSAAGGTTAGRINAYKAVISVDPDHMIPLIVDIDDGTLDGNDRFDEQDMHGDGAVDMRDFRRFRDWLLQVEGVTLDASSPTHAKFDLNRDGVVQAVASENVFARGDFNGDGIIDRTGRLEVPSLGDPTDLEVLQSQFEDPEYDAADLPSLLDSGDLSIDASTCLRDAMAAEAIVSIRPVGTSTPVRTVMLTADEPRFVLTHHRDDVPYTALLAILDAGGEPLASSETEVSFGQGTDVAWVPDCFVITNLDPANGSEDDVIRIEGRGFAETATSNEVQFRDPEGGSTLSATVVGAELHATDPIVVALQVAVPDGHRGRADVAGLRGQR